MLNVTTAARARLLMKLNRRKAADDEAMRFIRGENHWRLRLDRAQPDDTAYTHEGRNVLLLDGAVAKAMDAMALDVISTDKGARLKLRTLPSQND